MSELAPIEGAIVASCDKCDTTLLVSTDQSRTLVHHEDGSHGYDPDAEG